MKRALVVDDSKVMRLIVGRTVAKLGFAVEEAGHGREALERLAQSPIDLALVDWNMPVMNGYDLVKAIRGDARFSDLRIVMITTENDVAHMQDALAAGANDFVMKPFTPEILLDKLALVGFEMKDGVA